MRVVVVGGGIIGLLTAVECVRAGHHVTVVEQGALPEPDATSYDRHRVLRALHFADAGSTKAAVHAHDQWIELESLLGTSFYHVVGALTVAPVDELADGLAVLSDAGAPCEVLGSDELNARYPQIAFPSNQGGILEKHAGVLLADQVLAAAVGWLRDHVELHTNQAAVAVNAGSVQLADGRILRGDRIVVAAGLWTRHLLPAHLASRVVLYRQTMLYCNVPNALRHQWANMPAMPALDGDWLVPPAGGTPLKLSSDKVCRPVAEVDGHDSSPLSVGLLIAIFSVLIPEFQSSWITRARDCYYSSDRVSGDAALFDGEVLAYAACGGRSFKFAPLIAHALTTRLDGTTPAPTGLRPLDNPIATSEGSGK